MTRASTTLAAAVLLALASASARAGDVFLDVVVSNRLFTRGGPAPAFRVETETETVLDVLLYDRDNRLVFHARPDGPAREHNVALPSDLPAAPGGLLFYCLAAADTNGARRGVYPADAGGGEILSVVDPGLDSTNRLITYFLPRAAFVRVRAGIQGGPYLDPILPTTVQLPGSQTIPWDGSAQGGWLTNLYECPNLQAYVVAVSLPDNWLAEAGGAGRPAGAPSPSPALLPELADLAEPPWLRQAATAEQRNLRRGLADDYRIDVSANSRGDPPEVRVRVDCPPAERARLLVRRFEIMVYVDNVFALEDEVSQLPFTCDLTTRGLAAGRHTLTVNLLDTDGTLGTATVVFETPGT